MGAIPNPRRTHGLAGLIPVIFPPCQSSASTLFSVIALAATSITSVRNEPGSQRTVRGELLLPNLDGMEEEVAVVFIFLVSVVEEGDFQLLLSAG